MTCLHTFFASFFHIFDNDLSTSNKCHFQTVKARATGLRSYERSFNVVLGSHKVFLNYHFGKLFYGGLKVAKDFCAGR